MSRKNFSNDENIFYDEDMPLDEMERLRNYLNDQIKAKKAGKEVTKGDFKKWIEKNAKYLLKKIEEAWAWFSQQLGLS
jgi:predicted enzyme involved in methoxymalonyl-ACP biosynthesis